MSIEETIRAWKDPEYRESLTPQELATLGASPAGVADLSEQEMASLYGGGPRGWARRNTFFGSRHQPHCCTQPSLLSGAWGSGAGSGYSPI